MEELVVKQKEERIIGVDLLKIFAMILMVALHLIGMTGLIVANEEALTSKILCSIYFLTRCAVNCYAIASGFLCVGKKFKISRILQLWLQTVFYSLSIALIFKILAPETIAYREIIGYCFPFITRKYWYMSAYMGVFLFMPMLNIAIDHLSKKQFSIILILIVSVCSFAYCIYSLVFSTDPFGVDGGFSVIWLIVMYLCGAYIKKYELVDKISTKFTILITLCLCVVMVVMYLVLSNKGKSFGFLYKL